MPDQPVDAIRAEARFEEAETRAAATPCGLLEKKAFSQRQTGPRLHSR
jgi:hypothetical protein